MTAAPKFRIDVAINDLLTSTNQRPPVPAEGKGLSLPNPVFPQYPDRLNDAGLSPNAPGRGHMVYTNPQPNPPKRIMVLLVSRPSIHGALERIFRYSNWHLGHVQTCYEAIEFAKSTETAVVICEHDLPDGDWTSVLAELETLPKRPNVIVTAAIADAALWAEVFNLGGYDGLAQPFDPREVFRVISSAGRRWNDELWTARL